MESSLQIYDLPMDVFLDYLLPQLEYSEVQKLTETCKAMNSFVDQDCVWRELVSLNCIPWRDDDFYDQDTGGTSIRHLLGERMDEVAEFKRMEKSEDGTYEVEVLENPKGLLQSVANMMYMPYHIIYVGHV